jgi:hypothetical protein
MRDLDLPSAAAITSDAKGMVAMIAGVGDEMEVYVSSDGEHFTPRYMTVIPDDEDGLPMYLAVAGDAVAYSMGDGWGTFVSWEAEGDFQMCAELRGGPIAFQTGSGGVALFGAYSDEEGGAIVRVTREGVATRIAELEARGEDAPLGISALAWDESRRRLWAASPQAGLLVSVEPGAKKMVLS